MRVRIKEKSGKWLWSYDSNFDEIISWKILNIYHKSEDYADILQIVLVPICKLNYSKELYLQHDRVLVEITCASKDWLIKAMKNKTNSQAETRAKKALLINYIGKNTKIY